jgi:hypothetical protein
VGDINILSNAFRAEYTGIANIRVTAKRAGAGCHGLLFYNNKNSALAAWTLQELIGKAEFALTPIQSTYPESLSRVYFRNLPSRPSFTFDGTDWGLGSSK